MKKIDLEDVSFLIPVRIDSKERFENINWIIEFIWKYFNTTIIVLEADETERFHNSLVSRKIFVKDHDRVFHRTKYINKIIINRQNPKICRFYFYVINIQTFTVLLSVFLKPYLLSKKGHLCGCRALVAAYPALGVCSPAFSYYPHQI